MMPDKYEDNYGNEYYFPPDKKAEMKKFALYFIAVFGLSTIALNLYFYKVIKRWSSKENLIAQAKAERISSMRSTGRYKSMGGREPALR